MDVFLLKKIAGNWKIISKSADREPAAPRQARKVLLVVSNVHQYPGTKINAGNNFPEIAIPMMSFAKLDNAVDFVSPAGGAIPLEMIVTSDALLKKHLYDSDFMWALAHTKPVSEVKADEYAGMAFVGGGAAIVGIPDNKPLQDIALRIYEQQGGVIAAICHGTEGIKNLKLRDGTFLIQGKVLTSFPMRFSTRNRRYTRPIPGGSQHQAPWRPIPARRQRQESRRGRWPAGDRHELGVVRRRGGIHDPPARAVALWRATHFRDEIVMIVLRQYECVSSTASPDSR